MTHAVPTIRDVFVPLLRNAMHLQRQVLVTYVVAKEESPTDVD